MKNNCDKSNLIPPMVPDFSKEIKITKQTKSLEMLVSMV